jgi:tripartite-type tricarboxylate transporter receptor subunit TctC/uncharacterized caspase-like protein
MRWLVGILVSIFVLATFAEGAAAQKRVALLIGNGAYTKVPDLANPPRDSAALEKLLLASGFDSVRRADNLGLVEMRRALREFSTEVSSADVAVVFFAGHGIEVNGNNYLIPVDAALERDIDVEDEALPLERVNQILESAKRLRLIILDACRDNPFVRSMKRSTTGRSIGRGLAKVEVMTSDTLVAYAAKAGSTASDGSGTNSPYTLALINHLTTPGLDVRLALGRVRDEVLKTTGNRQEPFVYGSLGGAEIALVVGKAPEVDKRTEPGQSQRLSEAAEAWDRVKDTSNVAVLEAFAARFKDTFYAELARARTDEVKRQELAAAASKQAEDRKRAEAEARRKAEDEARAEAERRRLALQQQPATKSSTDGTASGGGTTGTWPTKPVTLVVPFGPGGPADVAARVIGAALADILGQQVVVENKPGAGGSIGSNAVAKGTTDGSQFVVGTGASHTLAQLTQPNVGYDAAADFAPVGLIGEVPFLLVARKNLIGLSDLISTSRKTTVAFASAGQGTASHLACALFNAAAGINASHVPYQGSLPAISDISAGKVDYLCESSSVLLPQVRTGNVKVLAVLDSRRLASIPDATTPAEAGVRGAEATSWIGVFGPRGMSPEIVDRMNQALLTAMRKADVRKKFEDMGFSPIASERATPGYLAQFVRGELQKWAAPAAASGALLKTSPESQPAVQKTDRGSQTCAGKDQSACKTIQACAWIPETGTTKGYCRTAPLRR